jgi:hypothetical protein
MMRKSSKVKPLRLKTRPDPQRTVRVRRRILIGAAWLCMICLGVAGFRYLYHDVAMRLAFDDQPPRVVISDRPVWMSDFLAAQIEAIARPKTPYSAFNHQLLVDTAAKLQSDPRISPWIKQIRQLRRAYDQRPGDTLVLDCDFRTPTALVQYGDGFWLVDGEGVRLPDKYTAEQIPHIVCGRDAKVSIRVIQGVQEPPPLQGGMNWAGNDLRAGLDMVKLLFDKPYAQEILTVDVSNFAGRVNPSKSQIVLVTRRQTQVRWGRPVNARDYFIEVPTAQKLDYMQRIFAEYVHIDAVHQWVDLRFDQVTYPGNEDTARQAMARH